MKIVKFEEKENESLRKDREDAIEIIKSKKEFVIIYKTDDGGIGWDSNLKIGDAILFSQIFNHDMLSELREMGNDL